MSVKNNFGEVWISETTADGLSTTKHFYTYACGHCSNQVAMNTNRERPRNHCLGCDRWICEQSEICNAQCTPLYAIAEDGFQNTGNWGRLVPAIMNGARTLDEAKEKGLLED
jgi:hypothetical protein